ncbi:hypothetical protein DL95DRAFT_505448 [Leptodontidium sp. 2 PMI_412]|nr:hypothetical protein DL95DRAFT_505448 [Leptodontidium sp. 2 PMI_412]
MAMAIDNNAENGFLPEGPSLARRYNKEDGHQANITTLPSLASPPYITTYQQTRGPSDNPLPQSYSAIRTPWISSLKDIAEFIARDIAPPKKELPANYAAQAPNDSDLRDRTTIPGAELPGIIAGDLPNDAGRSGGQDDSIDDTWENNNAGIFSASILNTSNPPSWRAPYCHSCNDDLGNTHYHCSSCLGAGYLVCESCADRGLSCPNSEHMLMWRTWDVVTNRFVHGELHTISRGLRVLIDGQVVPGIGDTGSEETIVSATRCHEMGWEIQPSKKLMRLGNQGIMTSIGTVRIAVSFPDRPKEIVQVLAHVVKSFCFDILLGRPFLKATQTMEKYIHRFKRCLFPAKNLWAFYRIGETTQRFHGIMGDDRRIPFAALPDTGSRRNVMSAEWALEQGLHIQTERENLGWITFPAGPDEATVGQVHTQILLPGGKLVPIVFDVLPTCRLPVVLGIDFVLDNNIYHEYANSFSEAGRADDEEKSECMGMGYKPWYAISVEKLVQKAKKVMGRTPSSSGNVASPEDSRPDVSGYSIPPSPVQFEPTSETQELKRQRRWDERDVVFMKGRFHRP